MDKRTAMAAGSFSQKASDKVVSCRVTHISTRSPNRTGHKEWSHRKYPKASDLCVIAVSFERHSNAYRRLKLPEARYLFAAPFLFFLFSSARNGAANMVAQLQ